MAATMKSLGIDRLSIADRLVLVQEIWDSIAAAPEEIPLTEAQKQEFDRRLADLEANPDNVLTWEEIKARVRGEG
jgi:putative addiction module component (TIGR02574 family)